jgi:ribonucleotide monophosphatase NagD (HAD superfamily)
MRPASGAMVGAVTGASCREPDDIVRKPNTYILKKIMKDREAKAHQTLVIGDW